jgi:hypothetical protein
VTSRSTIAIAALALFVVARTPAACSSPVQQDEDVTFTTTIEPLVREKCQTCHHEGGIAPLSLMTYEDLKRVASLAKDKVARREMPPWGAFDDAACAMKHKLKDDLSLSREQIDTFVRWVDRGMPIGQGSSRAPSKAFAASGLADKTNTYEFAAGYVVEPTGEDVTRCFPVDPGLEQDIWVGATNVVPGDPSVVHHALVYVDPDHEGFTKAGDAGSYPCFGDPGLKQTSLLTMWAPGARPMAYEDAGLKIPKHAHLVMQVHYHPAPASRTGRMSIELKALAKPPTNAVRIHLLGNAEGPARLLPGPDDPPEGPAFVIPSNAKDHVETMEVVSAPTAPQVRLYAVGAHMHYAGVDMKLEIERNAPARGQLTSECLLSAPKYDFNWQRAYAYDAPLDELPTISGGDKLRIRCTYDNTRDNPNVRRQMHALRLATPHEIRLGVTSRDEMCQAILFVIMPPSLLED